MRARSALVVRFTPGQVFAVLWWERAAGGDDAQWRSLAVMQALGPGQGRGEHMPGVTPAVEVLGHVGQGGPPGYDGPVDRLLDGIARMASTGIAPAERPSTFWRQNVRNVLLGRQPLWEGASIPVPGADVDGGRR